MLLNLPTFLFVNKLKKEGIPFFFLSHICLTTKISKILTEDYANLGPSLKHRLASQELPGFIKVYVSIHYLGFKKKKKSYIDTSPSSCASCWLSCFSLTVAFCVNCETDMCLLFSSAGTTTEGLIQDKG